VCEPGSEDRQHPAASTVFPREDTLHRRDAEILDSIVGAPRSGLEPGWWQELAGLVNGVILQVTTMPEAASAAMRQALEAPGV
jgi:hypothetical protein